MSYKCVELSCCITYQPERSGGKLSLPPTGSRLVGTSQTITVPDHNTLPLEAFAAQYGQGLSNMLEANPGVDPFCLNPVRNW